MKTKGEQKGQGVGIFSMSENQCIWMKAGVVNFKICENAFDCTSCAFDKGINGSRCKNRLLRSVGERSCGNHIYIRNAGTC